MREKKIESSSRGMQVIQKRGHPFMTSIKNDQFFDTPTPTIRKNEQ